MVDSRFGARRIEAIDCELYTDSSKLSGALRSPHRRFSDMMNSLDQDFVTIWDTVTRFNEGSGIPTTLARMLIRKSTLVLAASQETRVGREVSPEQRSLHVPKEVLKVVIEAGPYAVEGTIHMGSGVDLLQHVHETHRAFMPVTDGTVVHRRLANVRFSTPFLLVNRRSIEVIYDSAAVGHRAPEEEEYLGTKGAAAHVNAGYTAQVLTACDVFKRADAAQLQELCDDLCAAGTISEIKYGSQADIFLDGDYGETMYVVAEGILAVSVRDTVPGKERHLGYIKTRGVVGEMAALGNGIRNATVRTVAPTALLALHEDAAKRLMAAFPSAASALFQLIVERENNPRFGAAGTTGGVARP